MDTSLDPRYSAPDARPLDWAVGLEALRSAERWLLTSVRPDGSPHQTPLVGAVHEEHLWFCSGPRERKSLNLAHNSAVVVTAAGGPGGFDVVVEGTVTVEHDEAVLSRVAEAMVAAHGEFWRFEVVDGMFHHGPGRALVFRVSPRLGFGFATGEVPGQTRWRF